MSSWYSPLLRGANILAFIVTVAVNSLAGAVGLNGITTGAVSDLYPNLITPAGYVFSIWGVIYVLLLAFAVFQALPSHKYDEFHNKIGLLFLASCAANILWLFLFHYGYVALSVPVMFLLLASLIAIYLRLDVGRASVPMRERLCVHLPFSVYLGWITVAYIANMAAALVSIGWDGLGLGDVSWTVLVIIVALAITLGMIFTRRDVGYSAVIVWALGGIIVKQGGIQDIVTTAVAGILVIAVALVVAVFWSRRGRGTENATESKAPT